MLNREDAEGSSITFANHRRRPTRTNAATCRCKDALLPRHKDKFRSLSGNVGRPPCRAGTKGVRTLRNNSPSHNDGRLRRYNSSSHNNGWLRRRSSSSHDRLRRCNDHNRSLNHDRLRRSSRRRSSNGRFRSRGNGHNSLLHVPSPLPRPVRSPRRHHRQPGLRQLLVQFPKRLPILRVAATTGITDAFEQSLQLL